MHPYFHKAGRARESSHNLIVGSPGESDSSAVIGNPPSDPPYDCFYRMDRIFRICDLNPADRITHYASHITNYE